ncbi:MAG: hypothetical protein MZU95_03410 [Desulfomicrobium escambiense]|nr:hypothetical protein [Desulfomicrobium escambiense]
MRPLRAEGPAGFPAAARGCCWPARWPTTPCCPSCRCSPSSWSASRTSSTRSS